jgi:D-xylose transport system substrate-binding protein
MYKLWIILAAVLIVGAGVGIFFLLHHAPTTTPVTTKANAPLIGFSLGALREDRWITDQALFVAKAQQLGAVVITMSSDNDPATQISQIENMISQGVKVLVVMPSDSNQIAPVIEQANAAGVKVIAYDRMINDKDLDMYVSFDNTKVGELEAQGILNVVDHGAFAYIGGSPTDNNALLVRNGSMQVLQPRMASGTITLVVNTLTPKWDSTQAYQEMKAYLDMGKTVDAVVSANDGMAFGIIQALAEKGLAGKVPVSGQDADLSACQRIVQGTQAMTVYKPIKLEADEAAEAAVQMAEGQTPPFNATTTNGIIDVPSYLLQPIAVTKDNMADTVIKDGFHTAAEIYQGSSTAPVH